VNRFSIIVREYMEEQGVSVPKLAQALEVGDNTIYTWLHGNTMPQKRHRERIAKLFNLPAAALFSDEKELAVPIETAMLFQIFLKKPPRERPVAIIRQACKDQQMVQFGEVIIEHMEKTGEYPEGVQEYLDGKITELELYERCKNLANTSLQHIKTLI